MNELMENRHLKDRQTTRREKSDRQVERGLRRGKSIAIHLNEKKRNNF